MIKQKPDIINLKILKIWNRIITVSGWRISWGKLSKKKKKTTKINLLWKLKKSRVQSKSNYRWPNRQKFIFQTYIFSKVWKFCTSQ